MAFWAFWALLAVALHELLAFFFQKGQKMIILLTESSFICIKILQQQQKESKIAYVLISL